MRGPTRRQLLATAAIGATTLAGCSGATDEATTAPADDTDTTVTEGDTRTATADGTTSGGETTTDDLDLREANVTAVEFEDRGGGEYRFSVTLYHDDDGEDGYANWWQVETTGGDRLGRRKLLHAHGTREFTRSETIQVPQDVTCVVVRGHDQTHDYGGQAMAVELASATTRRIRQGSGREPVDGC